MGRGAQHEQTARTRGVAILDRLVVDGRIAPEHYDEVLIHAQRTQSTAEEAMLQLGYIEEAALLKFIANLYQTRFVGSERLSKAAVDPALLHQVPRKLAKRLTAFPILFDPASRTLSVVAADVTDDDVRQQMIFATGARDAKVYVAREAAIRALISKHYDQDTRPFELLLSGASSRAVGTQRESDPVPGWGQVFEEDDGLLVSRTGVGPVSVAPVNDPDPESLEPEPPLETQPRIAASAMAKPLPVQSGGENSVITSEVYLETLNVLVTVIEQGKHDRAGHSMRVARLCQQLGERIRLGEREVQGIVAAAYLHDLGVGSESHVTPLDAAGDDHKRDLARRAYSTPLRLLESVDSLDTTVEALRHRYERFDGSGFPARQSGKKIPLGARILAVAESYVELTQSANNAAGRRLEATDACDRLEPHKGTTFDPALVDWLRHIVLEDGVQTQLLASNNRVLIVDPDPEETSVLEVRFAEQGYGVVIERDLEGALRRVDTETFDVVVSEVALGSQSGFEFLQRIRQRGHTKVPVIFLTGRRDQASINRGLGLGAADYVVKPASAAVVAAKAGRIVEEARNQKAGPRGVSGSLQEMSLPDVIQILANGRKSGQLQVRSGTLKGEMMFQDGSIHDAAFGDLAGADAVYAILRLTDGDFALKPSVKPVEDRIGIPTHHLLLEAMRRMDEEGR